MRLALVQAGIHTERPRENEERLLTLATSAAEDADLVILPEMWTSGIHPGLAGSSAVPRTSVVLDALDEISRRSGAWIAAGSLPWRETTGISNAAWLVGPDGRQGPYRKVHLFRLGGEDRITRPGADFPVFSTPFGSLAFFVCYDLRFPEIFRSAAFRGARLMIVTAQWPAARRTHWETLLAARAVENQAFVLGCNLTGHDGILQFAGASRVLDPWGTLLAAADKEETILRVDIDPDEVERVRTKFPFLSDACWRDALIDLGAGIPGEGVPPTQ